MQQHDLIPHLFRSEFRKITAVLCKLFGADHISIAEDIASDTFLAAAESWPYAGLPPHPTAWLYTVARNKALNFLKREQAFAQRVAPQLATGNESLTQETIDFSDQNISDTQLQMLFVVCHPAIPAESQIGLALRILCGFGIEEIANAFLSNKETIYKRLNRAKEKLREEKITVDMPSSVEITVRLQAVLATLYLLFNEGYYSESGDDVLREDLCLEAMRLTHLLIENPVTDVPAVHALFALMCFHASRFKARKGNNGELVLYHDQDETLWDQHLISQGAYHARQAAVGNELTKYHLEANIAYWHTIKEDSIEKWENILQLYNQLLQIAYSPVAALNRTYALAKARDNITAIREAERLRLENNPFYHSLLGELYSSNNITRAIQHFQRALALSKSSSDMKLLNARIERLENEEV